MDVLDFVESHRHGLAARRKRFDDFVVPYCWKMTFSYRTFISFSTKMNLLDKKVGSMVPFAPLPPGCVGPVLP